MSISVIIPAYNSEALLPETLESVLGQTTRPDEVLVIDDGSTDGTAAVAGAFPAPVRVISKANSGQGASRNFGVELATSEWIAFVDADDLWEPNKLERQMEELARHPDADICYTGRVELMHYDERPTLGKVITVPGPEGLRKSLFHNTTFLPSSVVIRKSAFQAIGGFDPHFRLVQDWDLWLRLLHAGAKFAACPEPLVRYRIHPKSVTHNNGIAALAAKDEIYEAHVLPHLDPLTRKLRRNRSRSEHQACAAYVLRQAGDKKCLPMMLTSVLNDPFYDPMRYLALAHMAYTRLGGRPRRKHAPDEHVPARTAAEIRPGRADV